MLTTTTIRRFLRLNLILWAGLAVTLVACSGAATDPATTVPAAAPPQAQPSAPPAGPSAASATAGDRRLRWTLAPEGNEARYRVREQLATLSLPSDAVGVTASMTGTIVIDPDGKVVSEESKFVVDLRTLKSDKSRRDGYVQRNTLQTSQYPTALFVPTEVIGLPSPLPTSGQATFQLVGDLTVRDVTRSTTWDVTVNVNGQELIGTA